MLGDEGASRSARVPSLLLIEGAAMLPIARETMWILPDRA